MILTEDQTIMPRNLAERGFDLAFAAAISMGPTVERIDDRQDYGEARRVAIGRITNIVLTVVYTDRTAGLPERRIISARVSKRHERKIHKEAYYET
ncbi:MAG: BrnT family toxin [Gemmatimonadaceae bacterium]